MFLTLSSAVDTGTVGARADTGPATDLGCLLHKHPERVQVSELPVGRAHVFYPVATARHCTVALLLERGVAGEPLWQVHEAVFALESEPVDPRL